MSQTDNPQPRIQWDGTTWIVRLPVQDGNVLEAKWKPGLTYIVRIRESATDAWSLGFETPLSHFAFSGLKPDTDYEMEVSTSSDGIKGDPQVIRMRTNPAANRDNIIPFPRS